MSQVTLSHGIRAPLVSILMVLESMLQEKQKQSLREKICTVITQINLLLCLVTDLLYLNMLKMGIFIVKKEEFNPLDTFKFVLGLFA